MKLRVTSGADAGSIFDFPDYGKIAIGREASCDVHLNDKQCSRRHACITYASDLVTIENLDSTNGLFVNSRRHEQTALFEHDTIRTGDTCLVVNGLPA